MLGTPVLNLGRRDLLQEVITGEPTIGPSCWHRADPETRIGKIAQLSPALLFREAHYLSFAQPKDTSVSVHHVLVCKL